MFVRACHGPNCNSRRRTVLSTTRVLVTVTVLTLLVMGLGACGSSTIQRTVSPFTPASPPPATAPATGATKPATGWMMPDLVGSQLQNAQDRIQSLTNFGIAITTSHDATGAGRHQVWDRNWKVCSQNVPPGTTIDTGTRIDFGAVKIEEHCP